MLIKRTPTLSSRILAQVKKGNLSPLDYEPLFRICLRRGSIKVNDLLQACYGYEQGVAARMGAIEQENPGITSRAELADAQTFLEAYRVSEGGLPEVSHLPGALRAAAALRYHHLRDELDRICDYRRGLLSHLAPLRETLV